MEYSTGSHLQVKRILTLTKGKFKIVIYSTGLKKLIINSRSAGDIILFSDVFYSLTFAIWIIIMYKYFQREIDDAEYELTFMNDYSVEVKGIPKSGFTDSELIAYLKSYGGNVVELSYARHFKEMLRDYK